MPGAHDLARPPAEWAPFEILDHRAARAFAAAPLAARFAIETALCDAIARDRGISLAALLHEAAGRRSAPSAPGRVPHRVPLAAVIDDPDAARRAFAAGIRCFKIKLAAGDSPERVLAIARSTPGATLRIDANRSWPRAEVPARLAALASLPIEYVEEPCRDAHLLLQSGPLPARLALDESLPALSRADLLTALRSPDLAALVLKPTVLGGLSVALELAALARRFGVAAVASHALEGPIGTAACAELALALALVGDPPTGATPPARPSAPHRAAGLAAHAALAAWRIGVAQLAADHVRAATAGGLGFADLDLSGIVQSCRTRISDEVGPP
jgi:L-alanine-DL-glutamate epimerase-like enolase superfamily enzyme